MLFCIYITAQLSHLQPPRKGAWLLFQRMNQPMNINGREESRVWALWTKERDWKMEDYWSLSFLPGMSPLWGYSRIFQCYRVTCTPALYKKQAWQTKDRDAVLELINGILLYLMELSYSLSLHIKENRDQLIKVGRQCSFICVWLMKEKE